ncbi:MAG TPA: acylphosphatase [Opitutaceae bacterium]|nr:acylphosphatase [Opitutaceae bacterium]
MPSPVKYREDVYFTGHVQGVGFRYTALQVAKEYEVSGVVSNLPDGRVRLLTEGELSEVQAFVAAVEERMHGHIRKTERRVVTGGAPLNGFVIG